MIEARNLTKRYGEKTAVDDLSFTVKPGIITGFLGPNGSGKSTTMRLILGLDAPSGGEVTVDGRRYRDYPAPLHEVGVHLTIETGQAAGIKSPGQGTGQDLGEFLEAVEPQERSDLLGLAPANFQEGNVRAPRVLTTL